MSEYWKLHTINNYLKRIYELTENGSSASTNDLARELNIKPASVTGMIQKLANEKQPYLNIKNIKALL